MTRRRYIQSPEPPYELIEVTADYQAPTRNDTGALWGDRHYDGLQASDGTDISTRRKHREYMKRHNLTTTDDFKQTWAQAQKTRENYFTRGGSISRADVERAMFNVAEKRR